MCGDKRPNAADVMTDGPGTLPKASISGSSSMTSISGSLSMTDIRKRIDAIDLTVREQLLQRLECSRLVAESKLESGDYGVCRPDREVQMTARLSAGMPETLRKHYIPVLKKIIAESRSYQYDLIYNKKKDELLEKYGYLLAEAEAAAAAAAGSRQKEAGTLRLRVTVPAGADAVSQIITAVYDCGLKLKNLTIRPCAALGAVATSQPDAASQPCPAPQSDAAAASRSEGASQLCAAPRSGAVSNTDIEPLKSFAGHQDSGTICKDCSGAECPASGQETASLAGHEDVSFTISGAISAEALVRLIFRLSDETGPVALDI
jgi:chorismate mutase